MTSTPTHVRLTISVTPEVHATFERLSKATKTSMSKTMGQWLEDTLEAAEFMAEKVEQARAAPKLVMAEMHAYALGLADETGALMESMRKKGMEARVDASEARAAAPPLPPPSGNTGGKGHTQAPKKAPKVRGK